MRFHFSRKGDTIWTIAHHRFLVSLSLVFEFDRWNFDLFPRYSDSQGFLWLMTSVFRSFLFSFAFLCSCEFFPTNDEFLQVVYPSNSMSLARNKKYASQDLLAVVMV